MIDDDGIRSAGSTKDRSKRNDEDSLEMNLLFDSLLEFFGGFRTIGVIDGEVSVFRIDRGGDNEVDEFV